MSSARRWWQRKPEPIETGFNARKIPGVPDVFTGQETTYGAMRRQATDMAELDWDTPTERGLAVAILAIIKDFENTLADMDERKE